jgi:triosephosphate isomerase
MDWPAAACEFSTAAGQSSNAAEIFGVADVDGALVGGASLKAADFIPIIAAAAVEGCDAIA